MTRNRRIYLLSPTDLSPETIAVTFAKTSRSPKPFDEIASELTDDRSAEFHEFEEGDLLECYVIEEQAR